MAPQYEVGKGGKISEQNGLDGLQMGDYCAPGRGVMEIIPPEEPIMCPEGCIMPQRDAVDRRSRHPEGA